MKARPILFSTPMVQALLDGRKTQTRRVVKNPNDGCSTAIDVLEDNRNAELFCCDENGNWHTRPCPYGKVGDVLWVRETFGDRAWYAEINKIREDRFYFAADGKRGGWAYKPSIHMPRIANRLTLEIVQVRVQKLQEIDLVDALAEGVQSVAEYQTLWETINGKESWAANPWVWVLEFKVFEFNVDEYLRVRGLA